MVSRNEGEIVINDIAVLSTTRILVTDGTHITLRLVDSQNGGLLCKVALPDLLWGVCVLKDGRAAVTLPYEKRIQFICVEGDSLSMDRSIHVNGNVAGIAAFGDHLVVSYWNPGRVEKITMEGKVAQTLNNRNVEIKGKEQFMSPNYIAIAENRFIFVSDFETNTITQLDENLSILQTFTSPMLKMSFLDSFGIVSVNKTQLLVADHDSHNILVLDTTTGNMTPLLGQAEKIHYPGAVAWCPSSNTLYVCSAYFLVKTITKFES